MCTGLEIAAVATTAFGTMQQLQGQAEAKEGQLQLNEAQRQRLGREAQLGQTQAAFKKAAIRKQADRLEGAQRTAIAKSGVEFSGSAMEVMRDSAEEAELAILTAQYGADLASEARQEEAQAISDNIPDRTTSTLLQGVGNGLGFFL